MWWDVWGTTTISIYMKNCLFFMWWIHYNDKSAVPIIIENFLKNLTKLLWKYDNLEEIISTIIVPASV